MITHSHNIYNLWNMLGLHTFTSFVRSLTESTEELCAYFSLAFSLFLLLQFDLYDNAPLSCLYSLPWEIMYTAKKANFV